MGKSKYSEGASLKDKKSFAHFLSEDEELVIATGFGKTYLRQHFILQIFWPGMIFILGGFAYAYFTKAIALGYGLLIGLLIAIVFSYLKTLWTYHANRYLLTTRRVILKKGILAVKLTSALYDKITHIEMDQSLYDRLFLHHGMIKVHTAGSDKDEIILKYVESPIEFKNVLERLINREREHQGRGTGPVVAVEGELVE
ncbi:PH domain-containing protein [Candidatus Daviesbacteria bacterium]|nr:PH domain-containing protein [Candidatus Daviesbacteria bacterium]